MLLPLITLNYDSYLRLTFDERTGDFSCSLTSWLCTLICCFFYVAFNSQGHIATGSLQVEETSAYCTVNHRASASNYQLTEPAASEVEGENSNPYTTEPPVYFQWVSKGRQ